MVERYEITPRWVWIATTTLPASSHTNHFPQTQTTTSLHGKHPQPTDISLSYLVTLFHNHPTLAKALLPQLLSNQHPSKAPTIKRYNYRTDTK